MAGQIRVFEKDANGLLHQVHPKSADAVRAGRRHSSMSVVVDVLFTPEEEAAREAEEAAAEKAMQQAAADAAQAKAARDAALASARTKFAASGLTEAEIDAIIGA
jgi:flagellar biosynthesis/type III secretory pathway protein FliH